MMSMKSIVRIAAPLGVAFALVLVGTVPAFATWGDTTYASWRDISAAMPNESPHGDYDTASQKCSVCHAVHNAVPGGEKLLMSSAADACSYCHIVAKVSDYVVYDGIEANYKGTDFQNAHNTGFTGSVTGGCLDCHSVHRAYEQMTANDDLSDKLLIGDKVFTDDPDYNYDFRAEAPLADDDKDVAMSKWCTRCHVAAGYGYYSKPSWLNPATHVMKTNGTDYALGSGETTEVAYAPSSECSSCHVSNFNDGSRAWPHYTEGARFLVTAAESTSASSAVAVGETKLDGVCLRCHRSGSRGVGLTW